MDHTTALADRTWRANQSAHSFVPMSMPPASSTPGVLHYIPDDVSAFEPTKPLSHSPSTNTLIWIGGMGDTLGSVSYPFAIGKALGPNWSLMTTSLGSAGKSWGVGSIAQDAEDVADVVTYIKKQRPSGKIVIMGHSTGCQDCMEYLVGKNAEKRPPVDGVILQAPVSDREALASDLPAAIKQEADQLAQKMCREKQDRDALPNRLTGPIFGRLAITARRWVDVSSPGPEHSGADDYFSSDLSVQRLKATFGKLPARSPLLILHGMKDDSIPDHVDRAALVKSWVKIVKEGGGVVDEANSTVLADASHNLNDTPEAIEPLVKKVLGFIELLDSGKLSGTAR